MSSLILKFHVAGTVKALRLPLGQRKLVQGQPGVNYEISDPETGKGPAKVVAKRVGNSLQVKIGEDGTELVIEDFYPQSGRLMGLGDQSVLIDYVPTDGESLLNVIAEGAENEFVLAYLPVAPVLFASGVAPGLVAGGALLGASVLANDDVNAPQNLALTTGYDAATGVVSGAGATPGSVVTATLPDGRQVSATANPDGSYTLPAFVPKPVNGEAIGVAAGEEEALGVAPDQTPMSARYDGETGVVSGEGVTPGSVVTATLPDGSQLSTVANADGRYTLPAFSPIPVNREVIEVSSTTGALGQLPESILVVAVDEVAPVFRSGNTATAITESTEAGALVYTASASDIDNNSPATAGSVGYRLKSTGDASRFSIDSTSGAVTLNESPDFEAKSSYSFTVIATDAAGNDTERVVSLAVNNLDEVNPTFSSGTTATAVNENIAANTVVYTAAASDTDFNTPATASSVVYSLKTGEGDADQFSINSTSGAVTLTASPNFETKNSYSFTVIVTDAAGNGTEQVVTLAVNNRDEADPTFSSGATAAAVNENIAANTVVYTAAASDTDFNSPATAGSVTYALKADTGDVANFAINSVSGAVTLTESPNFETQSSYSFTVIATDAAGNTTERVVSLAVNNLDEADPVFSSGSIAAAVNENIAANTVVYNAAASDTDFNNPDTSSSVSYSLKADADDAAKFSINSASGAVTLTGSPNFEIQSIYSFTIVATDAAGNDTEQVVSLAVNNLDEVDPTFSSGATATAVNENIAANTVVYTATASDTDFNSPATASSVTYSLKTGAVDADKFSINSTSGAVTLTESSDFEAQNSYSFTVVATDEAGNETEQAVSLAVNNLDEVDPTFSSGATATAVNENTAANTVVYNAAASDTDFNSPATASSVTFSLKDGDDASKFSIDSASGAVTLAESPDFETKNSYSFTVIATDAASNTTEQVVSLAVNNLDEVDPTFSSGSTATAVNENIAANTVVYNAAASDTDFNSPATASSVTYSLKTGEGDADKFSINSASGAVTLTESPDFETQSSYSFTVVATDAAGNETEQLVTLAVNNWDEVDPTFSSGSTATAVNENIAANTVVYTAAASDTDFNSPATASSVTYSLKADTGDVAKFSINSTSGAVTLTESPDFETKSSYSFTVIATDAAGNDTEQVVTLTVNNRDEADPTFSSGSTATAVNENIAANTVIYNAAATDADFNSPATAGSVTYALKADTGDDASKFSIDANSGAVTLTESPDFETKNNYSFTVIATDAASNTTEQVVSLAVNNLDEVDPTFSSGATAAAVNENIAANTVVYTATASDTDFNSPATAGSVTYALKADTGDVAKFAINSASGAVTLTESPNFETQSSYSFTVIATDAAGNDTERVVSLAVNNLDEADPTFSSGATATAVNENIAANTVVYTAAASDTDFNSPATASSVTYSLKADTGDVAKFSINSTSGAVTLTESPDFETKSSYSFTVIATDAAGNDTEQVVTLAVNNLDEADPTFSSGATATAVNENIAANTVVYTAAASDTDFNSPATASSVTYSLKADTGDVAKFSINSTSGAVTLTESPDFETKSSYSFTVIATDAAGNDTERVVSLAVNNLDEVDPTFSSGATATAVNENTAANTVVYNATASDTDFNSPATASSVTYSLKTGEGDADKFSINSTSGGVTLTESPDFETQSSYSFTVVATDAAGNETEQLVTLAVNNWDEVDPTFSSGSTATAVNENIAANTVVYTAAASDTDFNSPATASSVTYSLKTGEGDADKFSINSASGAVTLTESPDFETQSSYSFTVVATDAAGNETEQLVTLAVNNWDEVDPTFSSGSTATAVNENIAANTVVYTAAASDTDFNSPATASSVTYSLKADTGDVAKFSINSTSGAVTLTESPDFETKSSYSFTVIATDAAGNDTEQVVTLTVNNRDEADPTFSSGATATAVNENIVANTVIYTAVASDTDFNSPATASSVTFSLKDGDDASKFSIDANSGAVTLAESPDFETKNSYSFTVIATDAASNTTEQVVSLAVNNLDEVDPTFSSGATATAVNENIAANTVVYTAAASDADFNSPATASSVTFSLKADTGDVAKFSINANSGAVTLTESPDFETKSSYSLTVIATDAAGNDTEQVVTLAVNNLDEVDPTFSSGATATAVNENIVANTVIYTATASDTDFNSPATASSVTYSLKTGEGDADKFSINSASGAVTLTESPNFEIQSSYSFTVVVTDAAGNGTEQVVTLAVNNRDEADPTFSSGATAAAVNENIAANTVVYTAAASDTDFNSPATAGSVTYALKADTGDVANFAINSVSGAVTLTESPNFETQSSYSFTVIATDAAGNTTERVVSLAVNNLDEADPVFSSGSIAAAVNENIAANTVVYNAAASDTDFNNPDTSSSVSYSLKADADDAAKFSINVNSGAVTLTESPDFEAKNSYSFTVIATDAAGNNTEQVVSMAVNNLNEAPTGTSSTLTLVEDASRTFSAADFGFVEAGGESNTLAAVFITALPTVGTLRLNGVDVTEDQRIAVASLGNLVYTPVANANGAAYASLGFKVQDNGGTVNGGTDTSAAASTLTLNVTAVNDNPIGAVTVSGTTTQGQTLTANTAAPGNVLTDADGLGVLAYQWYRDGQVIAGAVNNTYVLQAADVGKAMTVRVSYTDNGGTAEVVTSSATGSVAILDTTPPVFSSASAVSVAEDTSGTVYDAQATDAGGAADVGITYSLSGADEARFNINTTTGAVSFVSNPDFEAPADVGLNNVYDISVTATDAANNAATQAVAITVTDGVDIGQATISLGTGYGTLSAPMQIDGRTYYLWASGQPNVAGLGWDAIDDIFKYDINGGVNPSVSSGTTDTYRYATLNGVKVALPTAGVQTDENGFVSLAGAAVNEGTVINSGSVYNNTYSDMLAVWDAFNGSETDTTNNGSSWIAPIRRDASSVTSYWTATPTKSNDVATGNHVLVDMTTGNTSSYADSIGFNAMLEVLSPQAGQAVIVLEGKGQLINPVEVEGKWYYAWDRNSSGTISAWSYDTDFISADALSAIFKYDIFGNLNPVTDMNEVFRFATLKDGSGADVKLAVPTYGGDVDGSGFANYYSDNQRPAGVQTSVSTYGQINPLYDDFAAIKDVGGIPSAWTNSNFMTASRYTFGSVLPVDGRHLMYLNGVLTTVEDWSYTWKQIALEVVKPNLAPVLADTALSFGTASSSSLPVGAVGMLVSDLMGGVSDADGADPKGMAIVDVKGGGTLWYSTNGGATWLAAKDVTGQQALLLGADADNRIFFQPGKTMTGTVNDAITFRAWDRSRGEEGQFLGNNTTVNGSASPFSSATDTVSITVATSPLVLDLNGDGAVSYGQVAMDVNADGRLDQTAWAAQEDGVLVWDKLGNGAVTSASQYAFTQYGGKTDLAGLAAGFDSNGDGVFDAADAKFGEFAVWQDADQDGVSDAGEVRSLADWGITGISLTSDGVQRSPTDGVSEAGHTTAQLADGTQMLVADAAFEYSTLAYRINAEGEVSLLGAEMNLQLSSLLNTHGNLGSVDLTGTGANTLNINLGDVLQMAGNEPLFVNGDGNDTVQVQAAGQYTAQVVEQSGVSYQAYDFDQNGQVDLMVQQQVNVVFHG